MPTLPIAPPRIVTRDSRVRLPPKTAAPFYLTPEWRALMAALVARRGRRCEDCGRTQDGKGKPVRIFGDHTIELRDGGAALDPRNVRLLCGACHTRKTLDARARRLAAPA